MVATTGLPVRAPALAALLLAVPVAAQTTGAALGLTKGLRLRLAIRETARGRIFAATTTGMVLDLSRHSVRARGFRLVAQLADGSYVRRAPGPIRSLRGRVRGLGRSRVAGGLLAGGLYLRIRLGDGEEYWLEPVPAGVRGRAAGDHVLYRAADVVPHRRTCGTDILRRRGHLAPAPVGPGELGRRGPQSAVLQVAELACDADFDYFNAHGSVANVESRIEAVINAMNLQYERDIGVTHRITTILVRTSASQPYTSTDAITLLNQFRTQWIDHHGGIPRDTAHLFTGKDLDGSTIGIAWVGVICNPSFGYGVVQSDFDGNFACTTDLSAHELGHNWNADHCFCSGYTMNSFITCANRFHPRLSIKEMVRFRNKSTCLDNGGGNPVSVHVASISVGTEGAGRGQKRARAAVVIRDDLGNAVGGATVAGAFTGALSETTSGVTASDGTVTLRTTATAKGRLSVTFCVTDVTASLPYDANDNTETCDRN